LNPAENTKMHERSDASCDQSKSAVAKQDQGCSCEYLVAERDSQGCATSYFTLCQREKSAFDAISLGAL
uniref:Kazal-like domain-containing protein n=1 Tax=Anisakis simplex TaxID=6269 RepID=A0A0M3JDF4_ANISI